MAFEIFITVFCLKKFDNCIDMVLCLSCLIFGDPFESVESFYQIWKNCGHYFFKWFFCFLLPFFCLIFSYSLLWFWFFCFAFALLSLCFILIPLIALCRFPDFFHLQNAICYWEFPVNFSFQILHFSCLEVPFGSYVICFSPDYVVVFSKYLNTVILADLMYVK